MKNIFYDKSKIDYGNLLFPRRALWMLLIPLIIEQMLNSLMGMVDTLMVSRVGKMKKAVMMLPNRLCLP